MNRTTRRARSRASRAHVHQAEFRQSFRGGQLLRAVYRDTPPAYNFNNTDGWKAARDLARVWVGKHSRRPWAQSNNRFFGVSFSAADFTASEALEYAKKKRVGVGLEDYFSNDGDTIYNDPVGTVHQDFKRDDQR